MENNYSNLVAASSSNKTLNVEAEKKKEKVKKVLKNVGVYAFLTIFAVICFLPFYWMIISSLKTEAEYRWSVPSFFPTEFSWANYQYVITYESQGATFGMYLVNTLIVGLVSTILGVIVTIVTAYAFAKMKFKGKDLLFSLMLATMMIPGELFTTTNYITIMQLNLNNTYVALIIPFLVSVYYIFLLRNNFKQIPESLYKAAKVDGISDMGYLVKVMVPLTAPTLISISLLKFIGTWNSYIWPRLVNKNKEWQLISNWVTSSFTYNKTQMAESNNILGTIVYTEGMTSLKMAAACMVSLPLFILFICFRKYIMSGVSKSGTKG